MLRPYGLRCFVICGLKKRRDMIHTRNVAILLSMKWKSGFQRPPSKFFP